MPNILRRRSLLPIGVILLVAIYLLFEQISTSASSNILAPWPVFHHDHTRVNRLHGKKTFDYVDPLIGSVGGGHVFPGATLPFGMAKAGADVTGENQGGFGSDGSDIMGFSGLHDLGVGWMPSLGNFPIMPISNCKDANPESCEFERTKRQTSYKNNSVVATPGYFSVVLNSGITVDMTVTNHTAIYRFQADHGPDHDSAATVFYQGMEDLHSSRASNSLVSVDHATGRIRGQASFNPSFGVGSFKAYFCTDFSGADVIKAGFYSNVDDSATVEQANGSASARGAWVQFAKSDQILVRTGLSFISYTQACKNAEAEIPEFDFAATLSAAEAAWDEKFAVVDIDMKDASEEMLTLFWTGIYRSFISPQDYSGENPLWESEEPYYDSWYCIWDTFRTTHPLLTLLDQESQARMVRSLIDIYVHEGKLPDCRMSFCKGFTQGGSNADVVLADSLLKGISQDIDWNLGLKAALSDAEEPTPNWRVEGRGSVDGWREIGYLAFDNMTGYSRSISRTVEYGYDDFCIAEMAYLLKHPMVDEMLKRSHNWENLFNEATDSYLPPTPSQKDLSQPGAPAKGEDTGFVGFLQPRRMNGTFGYQDPAICSPLLEPNGCFLDSSPKGETYEGSAWLYTFLSSPSDMKTLIDKLGGDELFVKRLDYFHESGLLYFGDEQSFLTTYFYHYAGRPALSGLRVRSYIPSIFNTSLNGLPGNDDGGAMGAFTTLTMSGLFPNAGQDVYFIIPPFFKAVSILNRSSGKVARIVAKNFDGSHGQNKYIQKATLNGKPWTNSWIRHSFFLEGGTLELTLGPDESAWGTEEAARPPSTGRDGSWAFMAT